MVIEPRILTKHWVMVVMVAEVLLMWMFSINTFNTLNAMVMVVLLMWAVALSFVTVSDGGGVHSTRGGPCGEREFCSWNRSDRSCGGDSGSSGNGSIKKGGGINCRNGSFIIRILINFVVNSDISSGDC